MPNSLLKNILKGYWGTSKKFAAGLFFIVIAGIVSLLIIYPLWYTATTFPQIYTWVIGIILLLSIITWIVFKLRKASKPSVPKSQRFTLGKLLLNTSKVLAVIIMIYTSIMLFGSGYFIWGGLSLVVFLFLSGWLIFGSKPAKGQV